MEVAQLAPEVVLRDPLAADVVAERDGNIVRQRGLRARDHALENHIAVELFDLGQVRNRAVKERVRQRGRERHAQERAPLVKQTQNFLVRLCAVLDGVHAVFQRHAHALGRLGVRCHGVAERVRPLAHGAHHLGRHLQLTGHAALGRVHDAAGDHQFHKVGALRVHGVHLRQRLVDRPGSDGDGTSHVPTGHGDALVGGQDARADAAADCNFVAQARVERAQPADGADRRHAAEQLVARKTAHHAVGHRARDGIGEDAAHELFVVALLFLDLAAAGQMHVHVDEAGQQIAPAQVDARVPRRGGAGGHDVRDRPAVRQHAQPGLHAHVLRAVDQIGVVKCVFHAAHLFLQPGRAGQAGQNE